MRNGVRGVLRSNGSSGSIVAKREKRVPGLFRNKTAGGVSQDVVAAKRQGGRLVKAVVDVNAANGFEKAGRGVVDEEIEVRRIKGEIFNLSRGLVEFNGG